MLIGDRWLGSRPARRGRDGRRRTVESLPPRARRPSTERAAFVAVDTIDPADVTVGQPGAAGGRSTLTVLDLCLDAALAGDIDAICFAPLNKYAMKLGGLKHGTSCTTSPKRSA